jgi:hypothetical protein
MEALNVDNVRNFCVIAHVDHGKSTLTEALARRSGLSHKERPLDQVMSRARKRHTRHITTRVLWLSDFVLGGSAGAARSGGPHHHHQVNWRCHGN